MIEFSPVSDAEYRPPARRGVRRTAWVLRAVEAVFLFAFVLGLYQVCKLETSAPASRPSSQPDSVTREVLDKWYPYPDGPNAADSYRLAFAAYADPRTNFGVPTLLMETLPDPSQPLPAEMADRIAAYLSPQAHAIGLLETAADMPNCRFGLTSNEAGYPASPIDHHTALRHGAQMLYLSAVLEAERHRPAEATKRVEHILRIAHVMWREPNVIATMFAYRVRTYAYELTQRLILSGELTEENLRTLLGAFDDAGDQIPGWYIDAGIRDLNTAALYRSAWIAQAQTNLVRAALAAELCRRVHGKLPEQLTDLAPAFLDRVPMDVFDRGPLKYRVNHDEAIIYSVGCDAIDNGGKPADPSNSITERGADIVFRFNKPNATQTSPL